ncbi:MAG: DUF371 domain-containing protein [Candidatus Bathyarchaeia archaeon]|jgi:hypothetical protein|nr:DUF371 domain-containing protein [Candidatus Bathyarchaeota archaeon A05DMB-4]MDH7595037.1 DUF371 domain-containing protein [Candidatus Bathyarchaeota archaeon]
MKVVEIIHAKGHENILSTNKTTFEITKENHLTKRGDCIIAVNANKAAADLSREFKETVRKENARLTIVIEVDEEKEVVNAFGSPHLSFTHLTDLVVRKSNFICSRTLAIRADKAAKDFSRIFVKKLQNPKQTATITLIAEAAI